jgi:SPP1 gp7 family putative phage head morphogenesis protein
VDGALSPARILGGLIALDHLILKAKGKEDPWTRNRALEARLVQVLTAVFFRRAREGVQNAARAIADGGDGQPTVDDAVRAMGLLNAAMRDFPVEVAPMIGQIVGSSYMFGKELALSQAYHNNHELPAEVSKAVGKPKLPKPGVVGTGPGGAMFESWMKNLSAEEWHKYEVQVLEAAGKKAEAQAAKQAWATAKQEQEAKLAAEKAAKEAQEKAAAAAAAAKAYAFHQAMQKQEAAEKHAAELKQKEAAALAEKAAIAAAQKTPNVGDAHPAGGAVPPPKGKKGVGQGKGGGPKPGGKWMEVKPSFNLVDQKAVASLGKMQGNWIGQFYTDQLSAKVQSIASNTLIEQGLPRKEAAKALENTLANEFGYSPDLPWMAKPEGIGLPGGWHGTPAGYFGMLAANVTSNARNTGQIRTYSEIGVTHYEVLNPEDERTCPDCAYMNGKVFEVEDAVGHIGTVIEAETPNEVRTIHPWRDKDGMIAASGASDKDGHVSHDDSKKLAGAGFALPTFHGLCRCSIDIAEDSKIVWDQPPAAAPKPEPVLEPVPTAAGPVAQLPLAIPEPAPTPPPAPPPPPTPILPPPLPKPVVEPKPAPAPIAPPPPPTAPAPPPPVVAKPPPPPPAPVVELPKPAPAPSPMTAQPPKGFPWQEHQLVEKKEKLDGMHTKHVFVDPNGNEWIFKPQPLFRALGDTTANAMQRLVGMETNEFHIVTLKGKIGSIQSRFKNVAGQVKMFSPAELSPEQAGQVQREHIFDWLISQHDTHNENLLVMHDGNLRGIDKGQTFRFFGQDRFDLSYGRPGEPNSTGTYYHEVFNAYAKGKDVKLPSWKNVDEFLKTVEALDNKKYVDTLRDYAREAKLAAKKDPSMNKAAWMGRYSEDEFLNAALKRKQELRATVEKFYEELQQARAKVLGIPYVPYVGGEPAAGKKPRKPREPKKPKVEEQPEQKTWTQRLKNAAEGAWDGARWFVSGSDYEGMAFRLYNVKGDGAFLETKLRKGAHEKLSQVLALDKKLGGAQTTPGVPVDPYHQTVLAGVKSFNYHFDPKSSAYDQKTTDKITSLKAYHHQLTTVVNTTPAGSAQNGAAKHNLALIEQVMDPKTGELKKEMAGKLKVEPYVHKEQPSAQPKPSGVEGWKVERTSSSMPVPLKLPSGGEVRAGTGAQRPASYDTSYVVKITTPEGLTLFYHPHGSEGQIPWAVQGKLKIQFPEKMTPEHLQQAMKHLEMLGLETKTATAEDHELIYLRKVAYKERLDFARGSFNGTNDTIPESWPKAEQIAALKKTLTEKAGIKFPAGYQFMPAWDSGKEGVGTPRFFGHYIDPDKMGIGDLRLWSNLCYGGGTSQLEKLKPIVAGGTHSLLSTVERARVGVWSDVGGSQSSDIRTGGANYVFNRVRTGDTNDPGVYFKPELFRDLDSMSYKKDEFGNTHADVLSTRINRDEYRDYAKSNPRGNETNTKDGVNLQRFLDRIVVESENARQEAIAFFKEQGFNEYAGKKVEDLIVARKGY